MAGMADAGDQRLGARFAEAQRSPRDAECCWYNVEDAVVRRGRCSLPFVLRNGSSDRVPDPEREHGGIVMSDVPFWLNAVLRAGVTWNNHSMGPYRA